MSDQNEPQIDFEDQMQALAAEAERKKQEAPRSEGAKSSDWFVRLAQLIKPVAVGIESLTRASSEQTQGLQKLSQIVADQPNPTPAIEALREDLVRLTEVEASNQRLFDAMHVEMRGYKDQFLFDTMQKPFIKDVLVVFDDLQAILDQAKEEKKNQEEKGQDVEGVQHIANNLENTIHLLLEVLVRMDVERMEPAGQVLDKKLHKVVGFEESTPEEEGQIAKSVRPGFFWKERVIRPEEVILKRAPQ